LLLFFFFEWLRENINVKARENQNQHECKYTKRENYMSVEAAIEAGPCSGESTYMDWT